VIGEAVPGLASRAVASLRRARLSVKLIVFEALLTTLVVGAAFLALSIEIRAGTTRLFTDQLRRSQRAFLNLQHQSLEQLLWTSSVITESPTLRAAMETYRLESAAGRGMRAELLATVQREVERIAAGIGKDLLIVTDDAARVLAASERHGARPAVGTDLSRLPVVSRALDRALPEDGANFGVVRFDGVVFQIGCVPIILQDIPIGTLILGERLDHAYVDRLRASFGGELVVAAPGEVIAATLGPGVEANRLADAGQGTTRLGGEEFVVAPRPLGLDLAGERVALYLLQPLDRTLGPVNRALLFNFLLYGAVAVVLAGLGAGLVSRSLLAPFGRFVRFMESVAESGDYSRRFDSAGATLEIQTLHGSYNHLIKSLAQKHAQLEQRSAELSQANVVLTGEIHERERAEQALRSSEEQLRQSQKLEAIGTLAGGVAHDFNNLLTVILSYTELTIAELGPDSPLHADLAQVTQAAIRASNLTKQLLAFSRKQVLQPTVFDVNAVVAGVEKMLQRVIGEDIDLRTVKQTPLARVKADAGQIEQVIMNLAVNARDAMPRGGRLTIETANVELGAGDPDRPEVMRPGRWVLLVVSDTGIGMDEATRARIFEPFFTTKEPGKGTGLGLSMVYGIVKQSGGFIWVASEPGRGTAFKIYLPSVEELGEWVGPGENQGAPRGSETILLVEDEAPVRVLARRCLEGSGYRVLEASGPDEALGLAARHDGPIHLLLTDVVMPHVDGRELAERLGRERADVRVLYMSGYTDDAIVHHGVLDPGTQLLQKPFTPVSLAQKVREVLDQPRQTPRALPPAD
jgi:signal transduction histidine kinase/CheY-like chemotaxis protein